MKQFTYGFPGFDSVLRTCCSQNTLIWNRSVNKISRWCRSLASKSLGTTGIDDQTNMTRTNMINHHQLPLALKHKAYLVST